MAPSLKIRSPILFDSAVASQSTSKSIVWSLNPIKLDSIMNLFVTVSASSLSLLVLSFRRLLLARRLKWPRKDLMSTSSPRAPTTLLLGLTSPGVKCFGNWSTITSWVCEELFSSQWLRFGVISGMMQDWFLGSTWHQIACQKKSFLAHVLPPPALTPNPGRKTSWSS